MKKQILIIMSLIVETVINLGMHPANERLRYIVTMSLIGWANT